VRGTQDFGAKDPSNVVMAGPWAGAWAGVSAEAVVDACAPSHDATDIALVLDRLTAKLERLERREADLERLVAELTEKAQQSGRFEALAESLRNSRDYKVDEAARQVRELRGRIEAIEGPRADLAGAAHRSLVAIDRKLAALSRIEVPAAPPVITKRWVLGCVGLSALAGVLVVSVLGSLI